MISKDNIVSKEPDPVHRVIGYKQLAGLARAVEREMDRSDTPTEEVATLVTA